MLKTTRAEQTSGKVAGSFSSSSPTWLGQRLPCQTLKPAHECSILLAHAGCSLTGTLADTIGVTSFLTVVNLGSNRLQGTIPRNMTISNQVTTLDLSNNAWIVGSIPSFR